MKPGADAAADAPLFVHESAGRGDLALHRALVRAGLAVHVGRGSFHTLRVAQQSRPVCPVQPEPQREPDLEPEPEREPEHDRPAAGQQRFLAGQQFLVHDRHFDATRI